MTFREYLIFERSREGKVGCPLPSLDVPKASLETSLPHATRPSLEAFPEISEV